MDREVGLPEGFQLKDQLPEGFTLKSSAPEGFTLKKSVPEGFTLKPQATNTEPQDRKFGPVTRTAGRIVDAQKALGESALAMGTGIISWLGGSLTDIAVTGYGKATGQDLSEKGEHLAEEWGKAAWQPHTPEGQKLMGAVGKGMEIIAAPAQEFAYCNGASWDSPLMEKVTRFLAEIFTFKKLGEAGHTIKAEVPEWYNKMPKKDKAIVDDMVKEVVKVETPKPVEKPTPEPPQKPTEAPVKPLTEEGVALDTLNPTGTIFADYTPEARAKMPLGKNITTLDKTLGKPSDEVITVYRGVSEGKGEIVAGDFITTNKQLAKDYAGIGEVVEKRVKLSDVLDDKTEPLGEEYIYRPKLTEEGVGKPLIEEGEGRPLDVIEGTGETKTRTLAENVEAKAIENKLTDSFGDLPEYQTLSMKDQAQKASDFLNKDHEKATRVAMGEEVAPEGILPESVFVAVENRAIAEGNVSTLRQLAQSSRLSEEATAMGQRIRTLGERNPESPVKIISDIVKDRTEKAKKRMGDVKKRTSKIVSEIETEIKKTAPKKEAWVDFVKSIRC